MGRTLIWVGRAGLAAGILLIAVNAVMYFLGLSASYNIGDASKFEFILISFWHVGAALLGVGAVSILVGGRL